MTAPAEDHQPLDVRQWLICLAVALSIVVVSEVRKAVRRRTVPSQTTTR